MRGFRQSIFIRCNLRRFFASNLFRVVLLVCLSGLLTPSLPAYTAEQISFFSQPFTISWQYSTEQTVSLTPAVEGDIVYLPLTVGDIVSLRVADGSLLWKTDTGGEFSAAPVADERGVYVASELGGVSTSQNPRATGALRALGRNSGITLWMRTLQSPIRGALVFDRNVLFGGASDGRVYAVRKDTGEILWMTQHDARFSSQPVIHGGRLFIGSEEGTLLCLDVKSGKALWRYRTRGALRGPVAVADGSVFFGSADNNVYALRESDGRQRWRARTGAEVQAVAHTSKGLVVASLDNFVYFLSLRRGERIWKRQLAGRIAAQPLTVEEGALFNPLAGDACVVLNLNDGKQLNSLPIGEDNNTAASPVMSGTMLLVTTRRGLVAFSGTTGKPPVVAGTRKIL